MAVKLEAFKLTGRVEVEVDGAKAKLRETEAQVRQLNLRMKELRAQIAGNGGNVTFLKPLQTELKTTKARLAEARFEAAKLKDALKTGSSGADLTSAFGLTSFNPAALAATAVIAGLTAAVVGTSRAVQSAASYDALERGLIAVSGSADVARAKIKELEIVAKSPGLGFRELIGGQTRLEAAGLSAEVSTRALKGFGNALATVGKGRTELDGVILALTQIAAKSQVSAEEINQIAERVPQIREIMRAAFGTADTEELQRRGLDPKEFIGRITEELEKLPKATGAAKNSVENFYDAFDRAVVRFGKPSLEPTAQGLNALADSLDRNAETWETLGEGVATVADILAGTIIVVEELDKTTGVFTGTIAKSTNQLYGLISQIGETKDAIEDYFDYINAKGAQEFGLLPGKPLAGNQWAKAGEIAQDTLRRSMLANEKKFADARKQADEKAAREAQRDAEDNLKRRRDTLESHHNLELRLVENAFRREKSARDGQLRISTNEQIKYLQEELKRETEHYNRKIQLVENYYRQMSAMQAAFGSQPTMQGFVSPGANGARRGSTGNSEWDSYIDAAAAKYGVDPNLILATMSQESSFKKGAVSNKGASGLMQLMPDTARGLGVTDIFDPKQNIEAGVKYLAEQLKTFNGNIALALAAYNAGPGAVRKYGGVPPYKETEDYVARIMPRYAMLSGNQQAADFAKNDFQRRAAVDDLRTAQAAAAAQSRQQQAQLQLNLKSGLNKAEIEGFNLDLSNAERAWSAATEELNRKLETGSTSVLEWVSGINESTDAYFAKVDELTRQKFEKELADPTLQARLKGGDADAQKELENLKKRQQAELDQNRKRKTDFQTATAGRAEQLSFREQQTAFSRSEAIETAEMRRALSERALGLFSEKDARAEEKIIQERARLETEIFDRKEARLRELYSLASFDGEEQKRIQLELDVLTSDRQTREKETEKEIAEIARRRAEETKAAQREIAAEQAAFAEQEREAKREILERKLSRDGGVSTKERRALLIQLENLEYQAAQADRERERAELEAEKERAVERVKGLDNELKLKADLQELYRKKDKLSEEQYQRELAAIRKKYDKKFKEGGFLDQFKNAFGRAELLDMKQTLGEVGAIFGQFSSQMVAGVGSMVENWVLYGDAGPDALRKMTAQALASAAAEAAVQAIMQTAFGFAALARYDFPAAKNHFISAAVFGGVALGAAVAGRAIAGDSFRNDRAGQNQNPTGGQAGNEQSVFVRGGSNRAYVAGNTQSFIPNSTSETAALRQSITELARAVGDLQTQSEGVIVRRGLRQNPGLVGETAANDLKRNSTARTEFGKALGLR